MKKVAKSLFLWRLNNTLTYKDHKYRQGQLVGVSAEYPDITNTSVREGRFISDADDEHKREVIVIGPNVADALFPNYTTLSERSSPSKGDRFEIIGVLDKRKNTFFGRERRRQLHVHPLRNRAEAFPEFR